MDLAVISLVHLLVLVGWLGGQIFALLAWRHGHGKTDEVRLDVLAVADYGHAATQVAQVLALPTGLLLAWRVGWWEVPVAAPLMVLGLGTVLAVLVRWPGRMGLFAPIRQALVVIVIIAVVPVIPAGQSAHGLALAPLLDLPEAGQLKIILLGLALLCSETAERLMRPRVTSAATWVYLAVAMTSLLLLCAALVGASGPGVPGSVAWTP